MSTHHQWLAHSSPTVYEPVVMTLSITIDLNQTTLKSAVIPIWNLW
jgi:hypothetical protein